MTKIEQYNKIHCVLSSALNAIYNEPSKDPRVIAKSALAKAGELGKELDALESEDSKWKVIHREIKDSNRLCRKDIVNGEIVQLCSSLNFLASIYDDKTSEVLKQAHNLITAFVNADCLLRVFFASDMLKKYEAMKTLKRQLAKKATRCTNREKKIAKKLAKLEEAKAIKEER